MNDVLNSGMSQIIVANQEIESILKKRRFKQKTSLSVTYKLHFNSLAGAFNTKVVFALKVKLFAAFI